MKNFKNIARVSGLIVALSFTACTNLDEEVFSDIPLDKFFRTEKDVLMNAGRAYTKLQPYPEEFSLWTLNEMASDEMVAPGRDDGFVWDNGRWNEINTHRLSPTNKILTLAWEFLFEGISACNEVIYETEQTAITFPEKERIVAEIKVLRAFLYYWGMDNWGNIPFSADFSDKKLPLQKGRKFIFDFIEKDILDNIDKLQSQPGPSYYGRVTKGVAYALLEQLSAKDSEIAAITNDVVKQTTMLYQDLPLREIKKMLDRVPWLVDHSRQGMPFTLPDAIPPMDSKEEHFNRIRNSRLFDYPKLVI